jgi:hypothetical protein
MEGLLDNEQVCLMVVKTLHTGSISAQNPLGTGVMFSNVPNPIPSAPASPPSSHPNIPEYIAKADTYALTTVVRFLGEHGKLANIDISSADNSLGTWDRNIICVGGSVKTEGIMRNVGSRLVRVVLDNSPDHGAFAFSDSDERFVGRISRSLPPTGFDYGIILKTTYAATGKKCLTVMGSGVFGTEAAAYFLRQNATILGRVYGKNDFVVMVRTIIEDGPQSAELWWYNPEPAWNVLNRWRYRASWQGVKSRRP